MNNQPLFSVLIANHNDGMFIQDALNSVYKQTYTNYEIIIVDDGSTDESKEILNSLVSNPNIHIYFNESNRGCGFTKRKCVEKASGEICGFLDADDALAEDAIEIMVDNHLSNPDVSLIYSRYYLCNKKLDVQYLSTHQCSIPKDSSFLEYKRGAISHYVTFKKEYYNQTEGINEKLWMAEDLDLYYKLEEVGRTLFIDKPLYYYRSGTGKNTSLDSNVSKASMWEIIAKSEAFRRRNTNLKEIGLPLLEDISDTVLKYQIQQSKEYKIGSCILHPQYLIKAIKRHL